MLKLHSAAINYLSSPMPNFNLRQKESESCNYTWVLFFCKPVSSAKYSSNRLSAEGVMRFIFVFLWLSCSETLKSPCLASSFPKSCHCRGGEYSCLDSNCSLYFTTYPSMNSPPITSDFQTLSLQRCTTRSVPKPLFLWSVIYLGRHSPAKGTHSPASCWNGTIFLWFNMKWFNILIF